MTYTKEIIKASPIPKNWPELLEAIRKRPEMYLYEKSPRCFAAYVAGITYVETLSSKVLKGFEFETFEKWVAMKYNPKQLAFNSFTLVSHYEQEEENAFGLWYKWYDEFINENT